MTLNIADPFAHPTGESLTLFKYNPVQNMEMLGFINLTAYIPFVELDFDSMPRLSVANNGCKWDALQFNIHVGLGLVSTRICLNGV